MVFWSMSAREAGLRNSRAWKTMLVSSVAVAAMFLPPSPSTASLSSDAGLFPVVHAARAPLQWVIDIPAGSLRNALVSLARQTKRQVTFDAELVADKTTPGFSGRMTVREALDRLLGDTGLQARQVGDLGIIVQKAPVNLAQAGTIPEDNVLLDTIVVQGELLDRNIQDTLTVKYQLS